MLIQGDDTEFHALMAKITRDRGFRCTSYKDKCLRRRIAVRMRAKGTMSHTEYAGMLDNDPREYERLLRSLTISVTKFFRNWDTFAVIQQRVVPALWELGERQLRVWSAGCASGEEPYSLAILIHKHACDKGEESRLDSVSIVGTDIEPNGLGAAEKAVYGEAALGETPSALREKYFQEVGGFYTVRPEVRHLVEFQRADLLQSNPPFDDVHLLVCRNVVIYLEREAQDALFAAFHRALAPGGILVLGKVETLLGTARGLFSPVNARERIFRKL